MENFLGTSFVLILDTFSLSLMSLMTKAVFFLPLYSSIQQTKCNQNKTSASLLLIFFIDQSVLSPVILFWYYLNLFSHLYFFYFATCLSLNAHFFRMSRHRPPRLCIDQSLPPPKQTGLMLNQVVFFTHSSPKKKKHFLWKTSCLYAKCRSLIDLFQILSAPNWTFHPETQYTHLYSSHSQDLNFRFSLSHR